MDHNYFNYILEGIIQTNSISSDNPSEDQSNIDLINFLEKEAFLLGAKATRQSILKTPLKQNLLLKFGPDTDGGLLLSGHSDTVPCDKDLWHSDPFTLKITNDFLYGLGVIDMKGYFAHILSVIKDEIEINSLKKPLYILATVDEETSMIGAKEFVKHTAIKPDAIVIGEPTSLIPVFQHKGFMAYEIKVKGKTGHSSNPDAGINSILIMNQIIQKIVEWSKNLRTRFYDDSFDVPYPTVNIGSIHGGDSPNRICSECSILLDMRPTAKTPPKMLEDELISIVNEAARKFKNLISVKELYPGMEPFATSTNSHLIQKLSELSKNKAIAVNYCTEASFLKDLGCDVAIMGAGDIANAHQPNEYLPCNEIELQHIILTELIKDYCQ